MRSAITYYSFTGRTRTVAAALAEHLRQEGEVELIELNPLDESRSFFGQGRRALVRTRAKLAPVNFDLSGYGLICFGTPVWAFAPVPAMNTYLDNCTGVQGKDAILFTTYGSGSGNNRCLNIMQEALSKKGAKSFQRFSIQQFKVKEKEFVESKIKELTRL